MIDPIDAARALVERVRELHAAVDSARFDPMFQGGSILGPEEWTIDTVPDGEHCARVSSGGMARASEKDRSERAANIAKLLAFDASKAPIFAALVAEMIAQLEWHEWEGARWGEMSELYVEKKRTSDAIAAAARVTVHRQCRDRIRVAIACAIGEGP